MGATSCIAQCGDGINTLLASRRDATHKQTDKALLKESPQQHIPASPHPSVIGKVYFLHAHFIGKVCFCSFKSQASDLNWFKNVSLGLAKKQRTCGIKPISIYVKLVTVSRYESKETERVFGCFFLLPEVISFCQFEK